MHAYCAVLCGDQASAATVAAIGRAAHEGAQDADAVLQATRIEAGRHMNGPRGRLALLLALEAAGTLDWASKDELRIVLSHSRGARAAAERVSSAEALFRTASGPAPVGLPEAWAPPARVVAPAVPRFGSAGATWRVMRLRRQRGLVALRRPQLRRPGRAAIPGRRRLLLGASGVLVLAGGATAGVRLADDGSAPAERQVKAPTPLKIVGCPIKKLPVVGAENLKRRAAPVVRTDQPERVAPKAGPKVKTTPAATATPSAPAPARPVQAAPVVRPSTTPAAAKPVATTPTVAQPTAPTPKPTTTPTPKPTTSPTPAPGP